MMEEIRRKPSDINKAQKIMATSNISSTTVKQDGCISETTEQITAFLQNIASSLCQHPEEIQIVLASMITGTIECEIVCCQEDRKRLIGKEGKTITAIRTVLHSAMAKDGCKTGVWVKG